MALEPRISLITLGVSDIARSTAFYGALGWSRASDSNDDVTFIQLRGIVLGLYGRAALAEDAGIPDSVPGFSGVAIAHNVGSSEEVDATIAFAVSCGGHLVKPGQPVFWGGYSGYFSDPDGHLWEVAHNPFFAMDETGALALE